MSINASGAVMANRYNYFDLDPTLAGPSWARIRRTVGMMRCTLLILVTAAVLTAGVARADVQRGEKLFKECRACHAVERGVSGVGPNLQGVIGRKAGQLDDFRYSPALTKSGVTWTPQMLDVYVMDPQKAIPANRMPYAGMPEARDRADLIEYTQQVFK